MAKKPTLKQKLNTGGLSSHEFIQVYPNIVRTNRTMLIELALVSMILTAIMYIISIYRSEFINSQNTYLIGIIASLLILIMSIAGKNNYLWIQGSMYIAEFTFLAYGLAISLLTQTEHPATTFIVMIIMLPMLFIDKPIRTIICPHLIWQCFWMRQTD